VLCVFLFCKARQTDFAWRVARASLLFVALHGANLSLLLCMHDINLQDAVDHDSSCSAYTTTPSTMALSFSSMAVGEQLGTMK